MLKWIKIYKGRFAVGGDKSSGQKINSLNTDFGNLILSNQVSSQQLIALAVCFRGLLTQLMCTPYENREGWRVLAVRHRGTIYLHKDETEDAKRQRMQVVVIFSKAISNHLRFSLPCFPRPPTD